MMAQGRWSKAIAALVVVSGAMVPLAAQAGDKDKGAAIYKEQKCSLCHKVGAAGGKMGPELTKVGGTRDKAWLVKYLANPKAENPKNKMPAVKVKGADLDHLIAYMLSLK